VVANYFFQLAGFIYNASMSKPREARNIVSVSAIGMGIAYHSVRWSAYWSSNSSSRTRCFTAETRRAFALEPWQRCSF